MPDKEFVLKPCPFCGDNEAPLVVVRRGKDGWRDRFLVLCDYEHGGCGGSSGWYHYEPEAVGAWNRRATAADVEPKRKPGRWVSKEGIYGVVYCSICDFELKIDNTPYCPHCGMKMVAEPPKEEDNAEGH